MINYWPRNAVAVRPLTQGTCGSQPPRSVAAFGLLLLVIASISVHDAALVVLNHQVILEFERNPVGRWLIAAHGDGVWLFVAAKLLGTALACSLLVVIHEQCRRIGFATAAGLAACQVVLLLYLLWA